MSTIMIGNLTNDPELRHLGSNNPSVVFGLAVTRNWRDGSGQWQKRTSYFDCVMWGPQVENVAHSLRKGMRVLAAGRMEQKMLGEGAGRRSVIEMLVEEIGPSLRNARAEVVKVGAEAAPAVASRPRQAAAVAPDEPF